MNGDVNKANTLLAQSKHFEEVFVKNKKKNAALVQIDKIVDRKERCLNEATV